MIAKITYLVGMMQRSKTILVFILSIIILGSGCLSFPGNPGKSSPTSSSGVQETANTSSAHSSNASEYGGHELENRTISINGSINFFAVDLYRELAKNDGNIFFSPFSVETALAMAYEGARGRSAEEIANVLHLPENESVRLNGFRSLILSLNSEDTSYTLSTANGLWVQTGYPIKREYVEMIGFYYLSELHTVDFAGNPAKAEKEINRWAEERTDGRIRNLVSGLSPDTRLVITNAIYFKANWSSRFNPSKTHNGTFFFPGGSVVVPFMEQAGLFNYAEGDSFQALELPYEGERLSMVILLPKEVGGLGKLEANLTPQFLDGVIKSLRREKVEVVIPKFRFETSYRLRDVLMDMGMRSAFLNADFSGISDEPLVVSQVVHKAFISVAENGTEAAAATAVTMTLAASPEVEKPKLFKADHPFIFFIYDRETGTVLFIGRLVNPKG
jgi:serpin B